MVDLHTVVIVLQSIMLHFLTTARPHPQLNLNVEVFKSVDPKLLLCDDNVHHSNIGKILTPTQGSPGRSGSPG